MGVTTSGTMTFFVLACLSVIGAALVLEATSEAGVLEVSPIIWMVVLAGLGVWLLLLSR